MTVTVTVVPPTEPRVELEVTGIKNFQATGPNSFVLTASPAELRQLYEKVLTALEPYNAARAQVQATGAETI